MTFLKTRTAVAGLVCALFGGVVATSAVLSAAGDQGGTLHLTAPTTQFNPCNGQTFSGTVEVVLGVHPNANGTNVNVFRQFHGTLEDNLGNVYKISSTGHKQFDNTFTFFYDIPFTNKVTALGNGPSYDAEGVARIFVDANQNPIGYNAQGIQFTCR